MLLLYLYKIPIRFSILQYTQHYGLPEDEVRSYKALLKDSKERLGLESFVPWNQVHK